MSRKIGTKIHLVEKYATKTGAANDETIKTAASGSGVGVTYYDCGGASRTGVILEAGREDGQMTRVVNISDAAETITFATDATSNVAGGTAVIINENAAALFIWSKTLELWIPTPPAAAVSAGSIVTASLDDDAVTSAKIDPSVIKVVEVELTATEIVGTAAGDLGHAAGAVLVAAEADVVHEFISGVLIYDFDTAAYTDGGDDLVVRQGTTAVSAPIAAADLIGDSADDIAYVNALAAADIKLTANSTLNLKSTAFTNPGTAAGVVRARIAYRSHPAGLA